MPFYNQYALQSPICNFYPRLGLDMYLHQRCQWTQRKWFHGNMPLCTPTLPCVAWRSTMGILHVQRAREHTQRDKAATSRHWMLPRLYPPNFRLYRRRRHLREFLSHGHPWPTLRVLLIKNICGRTFFVNLLRQRDRHNWESRADHNYCLSVSILTKNYAMGWGHEMFPLS